MLPNLLFLLTFIATFTHSKSEDNHYGHELKRCIVPNYLHLKALPSTCSLAIIIEQTITRLLLTKQYSTSSEYNLLHSLFLSNSPKEAVTDTSSEHELSFSDFK